MIGETCVIGERVRIYQAVTLGAKRFETNDDGGLKDYIRHPIVEDDVVIYAGATILGRITIGRGSIIGEMSGLRIVLQQVARFYSHQMSLIKNHIAG